MMKIEVIMVFVVGIIYLIYRMYFRNYFRVRKAFNTLRKFLNVRDALLIKLVSGMKNTKHVNRVLKLIEERKLNFTGGYNYAIQSDVKLNTALKDVYKEFQNPSENEVINNLFQRLKALEKDLKKIRLQYNMEVEKYNQNLMKHKNVCLKFIRMKPLDMYQRNTEKRVGKNAKGSNLE